MLIEPEWARAALDATLASVALIVVVWAVSQFLPPPQAERLKWALMPAVMVMWALVLVVRAGLTTRALFRSFWACAGRPALAYRKSRSPSLTGNYGATL